MSTRKGSAKRRRRQIRITLPKRKSVKAVRLQPANKELGIIHRMLKPRERDRGNRVVAFVNQLS